MKSILAIFASFLMGLTGCSAQHAGFESVSADDFEKIIADTAVVTLDVRTAEEFAAGHIAGAVNIDVKQADFSSQAIEKLDKEKTIAVYCRSGRRSKIAASALVESGFRVIELDKGFNGWQSAGKPVER